MKVFIDTADIQEIKAACSWGIVDGGTTNPSLIKKAVEKYKSEGLDMGRYIDEICASVPGPLSLEVISLSAEAMIEEAKFLYTRFNPISKNVVIKIPVNTNDGTGKIGNYEGLKAIKMLSQEGIPVNATLVMTPEQALLAAKAGAAYVSPFMGRVDDYLNVTDGEDALCGIEIVRSIKRIFANYDFDTEIIAASIRNNQHVRESAEAGAEIATIPFSVLNTMIRHPKTEEGISRFADDVVSEYKQLFNAGSDS